MSESKGASRAVDRMVDAIRAEEPPELDWDGIERSLMARVRRGEGARPIARPTSGAWQVLSFAAAAALVPIALSAGGSGLGSLRPRSRFGRWWWSRWRRRPAAWERAT